MTTDKLRNYDAALRAMSTGFEHRQHKSLNNGAENSHQPMWLREKVMRRFKSPRQLQRFSASHDPVVNLFMHCRYDTDANAKRARQYQAFAARGMASAAKPFSGFARQVA